MSRSIADWYVEDGFLYWKLGDEERRMKVESWTEYQSNTWLFTGPDGQQRVASLSAHYDDRDRPDRCIGGRRDLLSCLPLA